MNIGRAAWNIGGALALSLAALAGTYWLVRLLTPLMEGEWGRPGVGVVVVVVIALFVILFVALLKIVPMWADAGERFFPEGERSGSGE